jgi:hypothetical protein
MRIAVATGTALCVLGAVLVGACSLGAGSAGASSNATDVNGFAQDFCNLLEPCCADAGLGTSGLICNAWVQSQGATATYDPASGQTCLQTLGQEPSATFCASLMSGVPACSTVFAAPNGTVQPGQPCTQDSDCVVAQGGGATCYLQDAFVDGGTAQTQTCVQTMPGKAGDSPCIGDVESPSVTVFSWSGQGPPPNQAYLCSLSDGLTCNDTTQACTALADVGGACSTDTDCVSTAYCVFAGSSGQCAARLADGAACTVSNGCLTTSYCDSSSSTCTPYTAPGAACTTNEQCEFGCSNGTCGATPTGAIGLPVLCGGA